MTPATALPLTTAALPNNYRERLDLRRAVTPQSLTKVPIHRWFVFPHSFGRELVWELLAEWGLGPNDRLLDPFVGAGTTLLAAKEKGIAATGVDLSPLAVFVSRTKLRDYAIPELHEALARILRRATQSDFSGTSTEAEILHRWFTPHVLRRLQALKMAISFETQAQIRDFFLLGLLAILSEFSLVSRDGGWLRWRPSGGDANAVLPRFQNQIITMLADLERAAFPVSTSHEYRVFLGDARDLDIGGEYAAVITSPPYPNRHDYSRIFNVELCFAFMDPSKVKELRQQSFRSHVEARPRDYHATIELPESYCRLKDKLQERKVDKRVLRMLDGYFQDLFLTLVSLKPRLKRGAKLGFVVGNVRYKGEMVYVDDFLAYLAKKAGYQWIETWIVRYRGNSAQQMGHYGREAARESIVVIQKES